MKKNREIRAQARETLGGQIFATDWLMALVACLVANTLLSAASSTGVGWLILAGPLMAGLAYALLPVIRSKSALRLEDLFKGFSENFVQKLLVGLMVEVFTFLWTLLFIIPGIVKSYSYSMAIYLSTDHPDWDWNRCITESRALMKGKKWKLFCLDFSFVGWYIVGALCFAVGVLWVTPYHQTARATFYNELVKPAADLSDAAETETAAGPENIVL
jgi:uncharacterized membrane protein